MHALVEVGDAGRPAQADQRSVSAVRRCSILGAMLLVVQGVVRDAGQYKGALF